MMKSIKIISIDFRGILFKIIIFNEEEEDLEWNMSIFNQYNYIRFINMIVHELSIFSEYSARERHSERRN